jgi:hypothetical protein
MSGWISAFILRDLAIFWSAAICSGKWTAPRKEAINRYPPKANWRKNTAFADKANINECLVPALRLFRQRERRRWCPMSKSQVHVA